MRGRKVLYDDQNQNTKKGRSKSLIQRRNTLLVHRYYYLARIQKLSYAASLQRLEDEIFLSQHRITTILMYEENRKLLEDLKNDEVGVEALIERYPFWIW